jgi:Cell division GTPase
VTLWVSEDVPFKDVEETISRIRESAYYDALIIFGAILEENKENFMRVAVVATDFENAVQQAQLRVVKKEQKPIQKAVPEPTVEPVQPDIEELPAYLRRKKRI